MMQGHSRKRYVFGSLISLGVVAAVVLVSTVVLAEASSPVGVWQTIDDDTGQPKSHVQIWERNGKIGGKIIKLINPSEPDPLCTACEGKRKNQKITGMTIMWGLEREDPDDEWWEGGNILDPNNGKIYRCKVRLTNGGKNLDVRGFIGISLIGRTQTWNRIR